MNYNKYYSNKPTMQSNENNFLDNFSSSQNPQYNRKQWSKNGENNNFSGSGIDIHDTSDDYDYAQNSFPQQMSSKNLYNEEDFNDITDPGLVSINELASRENDNNNNNIHEGKQFPHGSDVANNKQPEWLDKNSSKQSNNFDFTSNKKYYPRDNLTSNGEVLTGSTSNQSNQSKMHGHSRGISPKPYATDYQQDNTLASESSLSYGKSRLNSSNQTLNNGTIRDNVGMKNSNSINENMFYGRKANKNQATDMSKLMSFGYLDENAPRQLDTRNMQSTNLIYGYEGQKDIGLVNMSKKQQNYPEGGYEFNERISSGNKTPSSSLTTGFGKKKAYVEGRPDFFGAQYRDTPSGTMSETDDVLNRFKNLQVQNNQDSNKDYRRKKIDMSILPTPLKARKF